MALSNVNASVNGQTYHLTLDSSTGKYESTITAPGKSSFNLSGGYYPITLTATDTAGNVTTADPSTETVGESLKLVVKEVTPPVLAITNSTTGSYITNNQPEITFTLTDADSGVDADSIAINIDGTAHTDGIVKTAITGGYSCTYTPETALSDGSHTIYVSGADNDGNSAVSAFATIMIDTVPPSVVITLPAENYVTNQSSVTVVGTTNDVTSSPVTVAVNGESVTVQSDGSFTHTVGLNVGTNTITIIATDAAGKTTTVERTVLMDISAPVVNDVSISPNPVTVGKTFTLSVNVTD